MSAQGVGNYSDPASFTMESFPLVYIGAIVAAVVSLVIIAASVIVLVCIIWQRCTIRKYVCMCVCACMHGCKIERRCN